MKQTDEVLTEINRTQTEGLNKTFENEDVGTHESTLAGTDTQENSSDNLFSFIRKHRGREFGLSRGGA